MATTKATDLACLRVGWRPLLMPADRAIKVMALLRGALDVTEDHKGGQHVYVLGEPVELVLETVKASQIRRAAATPDTRTQQGLLRVEPLKLTNRSTS